MSRATAASRNVPSAESAVPTLRVMRLQSPELHTQIGAIWSSSTLPCALQNYLCLPDSLIVYVGESFTAYLGVLNTCSNVTIRRLTVSAQLQTPSQRYQLPSTTLDQGNVSGGIDIAPDSGIDAIVSRVIEESGQHILRIEVGYMTPEGGTQTFRKFYRFAVEAPLLVETTAVVRTSDTQCLISMRVKYPKLEEKQDMLVIASMSVEAANGFTSTNVDDASPDSTDVIPDASLATSLSQPTRTAVQLWDTGVKSIHPGGSYTFLFHLRATSKEVQLRGIAAGDYLGRAAVTWRKAMGETGTVYSSAISCPKLQPALENSVSNTSFASTTALPLPTQQPTSNPTVTVHRSGWTVDVAAASAAAVNRNSSTSKSPLVVTVEPIDPPARMAWNVPVIVQFLIVNHSDERSLTLQLVWTASKMDPGLVVTGAISQTLGDIPGLGGSTVVEVCWLPLHAGLLYAQGCSIVDMATGREMMQPPLFATFVEQRKMEHCIEDMVAISLGSSVDNNNQIQ